MDGDLGAKRAALRDAALTLPEAYLDHPWGDRSYRAVAPKRCVRLLDERRA